MPYTHLPTRNRLSNPVARLDAAEGGTRVRISHDRLRSCVRAMGTYRETLLQNLSVTEALNPLA
jgi:hypothetical protein